MLFWFHGDGAYEYYHPDDEAYIGGEKGILSAAEKHNMILIVPKTPDDVSETWWEDWEVNPEYAESLYKEILNKYQIDDSNVWQTGFSGGAQFTSYHFMPWVLENTDVTGGGAIMFGGGGPPEEYEDHVDQPDKIDEYVMRWAAGEADTAENSEENFDGRKEAENGERWYSEQGFDTDIELIPGRSHLLDGLYGSYIDRIISESGK